MKKIIVFIFGSIFLNNYHNQLNYFKYHFIPTIKEEISKQMVLKCLYTDREGETLTMLQSYVGNNEIIRIARYVKNTEIGELVIGNKYYLWNSSTKKGSISDPNISHPIVDDHPINSTHDILELVPNRDKCSTSRESYWLMSPPSDIDFIVK